MATLPDTTTIAKEVSTPADKSVLYTVLPYVIGVAAQLPLLILYYSSLWQRIHYQWFPFAFLATGALIWMRWPVEEQRKFINSWWSNCLLALGAGSGILGALFVEPWFAAFSAMCLVTSLLARTVDGSTGRSMWAVSLPLFVTLSIPFNLDRTLITWLQQVSAKFTTRLLDVVGFGHYMPGTVIEVPGKEGYGIEEACSGVLSFFTLLFIAVVFIVWNRRPLFRSILLIAAALFWAVFMNTVRIFLIPIVDFNFELDLAHGIPHAILGWTTLTIGILLLLSTDQFLMFLFGPVVKSSGESGPFGRMITKIWNNLIAGTVDEDEGKKRRKRRQPLSALSRGLAWGSCVVLLLAGVMSVYFVQQSIAAPNKLKVKFFDSDVLVPLEQQDLPTELNGWEMLAEGYSADDRTQGSDLGQHSDSWLYKAPGYRAVVSFDQTFPGWHELTTCYKNSGYRMVNRIWRSETIQTSDGEVEWPYIEAHFEKDTGERGYLVFSHFDAFGEPYNAPREWGTFNSFIIRAVNRLNHKVRARLFRSEAYQSQVFVNMFGEIDENIKSDATSHYLEIRKILRDKFIEKREAESASGS